jgi:hypothetical protein
MESNKRNFYVGCQVKCNSAAYTWVHKDKIYTITEIRNENDTICVLAENGIIMSYPVFVFDALPDFTYFNPKIDYFQITKEVAASV